MKICCNRRTGGCSGGNRLRKPRLTYERPLAVQQRTDGPAAWTRRDSRLSPRTQKMVRWARPTIFGLFRKRVARHRSCTKALSRWSPPAHANAARRVRAAAHHSCALSGLEPVELCRTVRSDFFIIDAEKKQQRLPAAGNEEPIYGLSMGRQLVHPLWGGGMR